ncbi:MAG: inositol monophosphatase family protein [Bacillota bacterium]|nr:inositol monophosphatase family protein [Bacillota bacterium]
MNKLLQNVMDWVREIGEEQVRNLGRADLKFDQKSSCIDLVSEVDRWSEEQLIKNIHREYPGHAILAEESGEEMSDSEYRWVIDPLDGTTNYAQGLPIFVISVALQMNKETVLGVIYAPVLGQMFTAVKGEGTFLNAKRLQISQKEHLNECVLATGFPYDRATHKENNVAYFNHFITRVRGIRRMGSAAYDLACVAGGMLDGYWELNLSLWDVAAGALLVEEAGGQVHYLTEKRGVSLVTGNSTISHVILGGLALVKS